ncbi:MAG: peptidoglycan editing factor PgeF [Phycisphaerae bacterium]|nr:peptidoglycan editing factor PgeF [Phycisphaerae bacterium]
MSDRLLVSPLLSGVGVPHGFSTRRGGVSTGIFASLNFGNPSELGSEQRDPPENIARNLAQIMRDLGTGSRDLAQVHQVHAAEVVTLRRGDPDGGRTRHARADGLLTDDPGRAVGVRVADCAPVLLASECGAIVAAVHAGWRGVIAGVVARAVDSMRRLAPGAPPRLIAAIGPCIGPEAFEVGAEVAAAFTRAFDSDDRVVRPRTTTPGPWRVDLKEALRLQLVRAGVDAIDIIPGCTASEPQRFFSHRRERGRTGRMIAVIGPK